MPGYFLGATHFTGKNDTDYFVVHFVYYNADETQVNYSYEYVDENVYDHFADIDKFEKIDLICKLNKYGKPVVGLPEEF